MRPLSEYVMPLVNLQQKMTRNMHDNFIGGTFKKFCGIRSTVKKCYWNIFFNDLGDYAKKKLELTRDKIRRRMLGVIVEEKVAGMKMMKNTKNVPDSWITLVNLINVNICKVCGTRYSEKHMDVHGWNWNETNQEMLNWLKIREDWEEIKSEKLRRRKELQLQEIRREADRKLRQIIKDVIKNIDKPHLRGLAPLK